MEGVSFWQCGLSHTVPKHTSIVMALLLSRLGVLQVRACHFGSSTASAIWANSSELWVAGSSFSNNTNLVSNLLD